MSLVARPDPVRASKNADSRRGDLRQSGAEDLARDRATDFAAGKIQPTVSRFLPLSQAIAAKQQAATKHTRGKVGLRIADEPKS